jgi:hypothetical protein
MTMKLLITFAFAFSLVAPGMAMTWPFHHHHRNVVHHSIPRLTQTILVGYVSQVKEAHDIDHGAVIAAPPSSALSDPESLFFSESWKMVFDETFAPDGLHAQDIHVRQDLAPPTAHHHHHHQDDDNNDRLLRISGRNKDIYTEWSADCSYCSRDGDQYARRAAQASSSSSTPLRGNRNLSTNAGDGDVPQDVVEQKTRALHQVFEDRLCETLRQGPFPSFHSLTDCRVIFLPHQQPSN